MATTRLFGFSKFREIASINIVRNCSVNVACAKSGVNGFQEDFQACHLETSPLQKFMLGFGSAVVSLANPRRGDMIAVMGETTGTQALEFIMEKMLQSDEGKRIILDKPRINSSTVDLQKLGTLGDETVGKAYYNFLSRYGYTPDARLAVRFVDDIELAYVIQRYREVHDLFHTILAMPTNMLGEVTVKWIEGIQTRLPMCVGGALFGATRLAPKYSRSYSTQRLQIDENVRIKIEVEGMKPKKHPGIMQLPCISIPESIRKTITAITEDRQLPEPAKGGKQLEGYLVNRKLPAEPQEIKERKKQCYEEVLNKFSFGDVTPTNQDEQDYLNKLTSEQVDLLMKSRTYNWKPLKMDSTMAHYYLIGRSAAEYAVLIRLFNEIMLRDKGFSPRNLFDFGSGVGTVSWAANKLWGETLREYYTVDSSPDANDLALLILQHNNPTSPPFFRTLYQRQFLPATPRQYDLVVSAYSLFELDSLKARLSLIENLWKKTDKYLVLVEHGTNAGFQAINEARDFILHKSEGSGTKCHVFAPCPHDLACPRLTEPQVTPCNFIVKYSSLGKPSQEHRYEGFSYVIMKKGERDDSQWPRIVREVLPRHKHTVCRLCTKNGSLKDIVITSSKHGKSAYKCSRQSKWGDIFPVTLSEKDENPV